MNWNTIIGAAAIGLILIPGLSAQEETGTEVHGSLKTGALVTPALVNSYDIATKSSYLIDNTLVGKLGNESGQSFGLDIVQNFPGLDGTWAKAHLTLEGYYMNFASAAYTANKPANKTADGGTKGYNPYLTQAFVEMGGFYWDPKAALWAGTRYYGGDGIAISGFNYVDRSGAGFGVTGLAGGAIDVAVLTDDSLVAGGLKPVVPVNAQVKIHLGNLVSLEAVAAYAANATEYTAVDYTATSGAEFMGVVHLDSFYGLSGGTSKVALQGGYGMLGNAETTTSALWSQLGKVGSVWTYQNSLSMRAVTYGLFTAGDFDLMPAVWVQYDTQTAVDNVDGSAAEPRIVASAVIRPVWKADKTISVLFEAGVAEQLGGLNGSAADGSGDQAAGVAWKVTVGPTFALDSGFWALPQIRLLASWQQQDARLGYLGPNEENSALWLGVQAEARW